MVMKVTKEEFLIKISEQLDKLPVYEDLDCDYICISFADYVPKNEKFIGEPYNYRRYDIKLDLNDKLGIEDLSEKFKCSCNNFNCQRTGICTEWCE